jgi:hypothetical protein
MNTGEAEFAAWQKAFPCPGLLRVVAAARVVEKSTPWGASAAGCDELRKEIAASKSPSERADLAAHLREMERQIFEFRGEAAIRANSVFSSGESLALLLGDLRRMAAAMEQELAHREASDPLRALMAGFLSQHARPALALYAAAVENAKAGKKLPPALQPECASFLLGRGDWHSMP